MFLYLLHSENQNLPSAGKGRIFCGNEDVLGWSSLLQRPDWVIGLSVGHLWKSFRRHTRMCVYLRACARRRITFCGRCRGTAVWQWCPLAAVPPDRWHTRRHPWPTRHLREARCTEDRTKMVRSDSWSRWDTTSRTAFCLLRYLAVGWNWSHMKHNAVLNNWKNIYFDLNSDMFCSLASGFKL